MTPLFLFVRPPRPLWPFNGPSTAFWPPLAFASMAAALRENIPDLRVAIIDAPALQMGWRTLAATMKSLAPKYVAIGEEAVSCVEGLRIATLAKELGATVIAGGCFFSYVATHVLATGLVDFVVHGEGEITIVELTQALAAPDSTGLSTVAGISFRDGEEIVFTGWRELISNLDNLPFPAYDLLPVDRYGRTSRHHPHFAAVESSRGCTHACQFCVLWRQMGRFNAHRPEPCLRVKSPERLLEEIRILTTKHNRRYLGWVDPCFNADAQVPARLSELLLKNKLTIGQSAWTRADYILRDDESGALRQCTRAGLNEAYIGVERLDPQELATLGKGNLHHEVERAAGLLYECHPQLVTFGSLIYGIPGDTPDSVRALFLAAAKLPLDELFFIPFTPLPGTPAWSESMWDETGRAFRAFDFIPGDQQQTAELSSVIARSYLFDWPSPRRNRMLSDLFSRNRRRRGIALNIFGRAIPLMLSAGFKFRAKGGGAMMFPAWYEN